MTFALWTILVAAVLPLLSTGIAKGGGSGYDNAAPRDWEQRLTGWRQRANWAQRNHYEAFGPYAAAVLVAHLVHAPQGRVDTLAATFIAARLAYTAAYITGRSTLRSILWAVGFASVTGLFVVTVL